MLAFLTWRIGYFQVCTARVLAPWRSKGSQHIKLSHTWLGITIQMSQMVTATNDKQETIDQPLRNFVDQKA